MDEEEVESSIEREAVCSPCCSSPCPLLFEPPSFVLELTASLTPSTAILDDTGDGVRGIDETERREREIDGGRQLRMDELCQTCFEHAIGQSVSSLVVSGKARRQAHVPPLEGKEEEKRRKKSENERRTLK